jgi:hypothetical protein
MGRMSGKTAPLPEPPCNSLRQLTFRAGRISFTLEVLRLATFLLIGLYFAVQAQTYWPFVEYALHRDYIARELCMNRDVPALDCQGHCYLQQALRQAGEERQENQPTAPSSSDLSWQPHQAQEPLSQVPLVFIEVEVRPLAAPLSGLRPQPLYPPPRV